MNYIQRISDCMDKEAENVAFLSYFTTAKLEQKLLLVRNQIEIATRHEQRDALSLLQLWAKQITDAQELKKLLKPEENPLLDMHMELPEIMAFELLQNRQELLKNKLLKEEMVKEKF